MPTSRRHCLVRTSSYLSRRIVLGLTLSVGLASVNAQPPFQLPNTDEYKASGSRWGCGVLLCLASGGAGGTCSAYLGRLWRVLNARPTTRPVTVIRVGGKSLVSGLYWQTLSQPNRIMREAREIGRRDQMDVVAIRKLPTIIQAGFVRRESGAQKGMYSLASVVADLLLPKDGAGSLDPLIAAFALGDGRYAVVAFKDGGVVPDSDHVADDANDASRLLRQLYALLGSKGRKISVHAPAELNFGTDAAYTLDQLAKALRANHRLRPLRFGLSRREWIYLAILAVAFVASVTALYLWRESVREREAALERARAEQLRQIAAESGKQDSPKALEHPWTKMPTVTAMLDHCKQLNRIPGPTPWRRAVTSMRRGRSPSKTPPEM